MSTSVQSHLSQRKTRPVKAAPQVRAVPTPPPAGLTREEIRQIVIEMIG